MHSLGHAIVICATVGDSGDNVGATGAEVGVVVGALVGGIVGALVGGVTGSLAGGVATGTSVGLDLLATNCSKSRALILASNSFPSPQSCSLVKDSFWQTKLPSQLLVGMKPEKSTGRAPG